MISYSASLNSLEEETFIQIIVGGDLTAFDSFVNSWYSLGGETITQEVNAGALRVSGRGAGERR